MAPKIKASLTNANFSMLYPNENNTEHCAQNLNNWSSFLPEAMATIIETRRAVFHVYSSDGDYKFGEISAKIWTHKDNKITYFVASSKAWNKSDIVKLVNSVEYELGTLWIQLFSENYDESKVDPVRFYQSAAEIGCGNRGDPNIQCIGSVADGKEIIWENPKWAEVEELLPQLKAICENHGFVWELLDNRN